jgi:V/A-type H+-transporting ATPase subunit E
MAEEIRDLIEKIHQEGIKAAEEKSQLIEEEARQKADAILAQARQDAEEMMVSAKARVRLEDEKGKALLAQAGRDLLLSLRIEINAMLGRIMVSEVAQTLTPETISGLIRDVVSEYGREDSHPVTVELNSSAREILELHFLRKLEEETKRSIVLRPSDEITGGFTISFDSERSRFDFTDGALAEYLGTHLKPRLNQILIQQKKE